MGGGGGRRGVAGDRLWLFYPGHRVATEINCDASWPMCLCLPSSYSTPGERVRQEAAEVSTEASRDGVW